MATVKRARAARKQRVRSERRLDRDSPSNKLWHSQASQTVRKNYSLAGFAYGIKPTKIGNRLLWSVAQIAEKLRGAL